MKPPWKRPPSTWRLRWSGCSHARKHPIMAGAAPVRCDWTLKGNELYLAYHDTEWGVPARDDRTQFEFLILEGAQAGLAWSTVLNKREGYRAAFADFDPEKIARFGKREVTRLMNDPGII